MKRLWFVVMLCLLPVNGHAAKYALLVGIDAYAGANRLQGCVKDAQRMAQVLTQKFGFPAGNVQVLTDGAATRAGIETAFRAQLLRQARPGDVVVLYYSGHGTQVPDKDGDEADQLDEALCPVDISKFKAETWLTDDVIRTWLAELPTDNVIVIFDSCHSGTGTRGKLVAKAMDLGFAKSGQAAGPANFVPTAMRHVLLAGCAADESSYMRQDGNGSVFTTLLAELLTQPAGEFTYATLMQQLVPRVQAYVQTYLTNATQTPQLEGDSQRPFFGGADLATPTPRPTVTPQPTPRPTITPQPTARPRPTITPRPAPTMPNTPAAAITLTLTSAKSVYADGEFVTLTVQANRDCYLKLYNTRADGRVYLAFPNEWGRNNFITGGQAVTIPGPQDAFGFKAGKPYGTESVRAVAAPTQFEEIQNMNWEGKGFVFYGQSLPEKFEVLGLSNQAVVTYEVKPR